jgi:hypothetical protein
MKKQFKIKDTYLPVPAALIVCGTNDNYNLLCELSQSIFNMI